MNILEILLLILPVFLSGLTFIMILNAGIGEKFAYPLDARIIWKDKRLFGKNKTIRGPIVMGFFTMVYGFIVYIFLKSRLDFQFTNQEVLIYFFTVGIAYSLAELPNSFLKRRLSISPGDTAREDVKRYLFRLLDTFDSLFGCGLVYILLFHFSLKTVLTAVTIGGLIHILTDKVMGRLRLK